MDFSAKVNRLFKWSGVNLGRRRCKFESVNLNRL